MLLVGVYIFLAGCVGGLLNAFFPHQALVLPRVRTIRGRRTLEPGWVGNVAVGGIAALALWGLYGPHSGVDLLAPAEVVAPLRLGQVFAALLTGLGGGRVLTTQAARLSLQVSNDALGEALGRAVAAVGAMGAMAEPEEETNERRKG